MDTTEIRRRLRVDEVSLMELRIVLQQHFRTAGHGTGDSIECYNDAGVALALVYQGEQFHVEPGPALADSDIAAVERLLQQAVLADVGHRTRRLIAFADVPVNGSWRYRDSVQILPAPSAAPRPPQLFADHPFVVEVSYPHSPDSVVANYRAARVVRETMLVLLAVVPKIKGAPTCAGQHLWALSLEDDPPSTPRPVWSEASYFFPGFEMVTEGLTPDPGPALNAIDDGAYYGRRGRVFDEELDLPASINTMFDRFRALSQGRQDRFLRWSYWLEHARHAYALSTSASYMALVQAIEALRPRLSGGPACPDCGRSTGPGPTRQFVDFMNTYVPTQDPASEKERTKLYALRSGLTHGGKLLRDDVDRSFAAQVEPASLRESDAARKAEYLARLAGLNWLLAAGD